MKAFNERTIPRLLGQAVSLYPDSPFIVFKDEIYTYKQTDEISNRAGSLFARGRVEPGDHVAMLMDNSPEFVWTLLGLMKLGAVAVPLNTAATGRLLGYFVDDSECRFVVSDAQYLPELQSVVALSSLRKVWIRNPTKELLASDSSIRDLEHEMGLVDIDHTFNDRSYRDVALLMYTSGTTGPSKAVVVPHALPVTTAQVVADTFGLNSSDRLYTCLPLFHGNAMWYSMLTAMTVGGSVALVERFSASRFWEEVAAFGATQVNAMGSMMRILEKHPVTSEERNNALRIAFVVPFPSDPVAFEDRYEAKITTTFGLTEMNPISLSKPGEGYDRPGMAGPFHSRFEVRIVDGEDRPVPIGEPGEIVVRPNEPWTSFSGYHNKPVETLAAFRNLWFHTGDVGRIDGDGYIYFLARRKDAIRRRGENISAFELEEFLGEHPSLLEVAAVAIPSDLTEDDVVVFVVPMPEVVVTEVDVFMFATRNLPKYMVPRYIKIVESLPKTSTSRVEKYRLRREAEEHRDELWDAEHQQMHGSKPNT